MAITWYSIQNPDWSEQRDRSNARPGKEGTAYYPCLVCGRRIDTNDPKVVLLRLFNGGGEIVTQAEADAAYAANPEDAAAGDMGGYPIGRDCLRKHPEVKPYIMN